MKPRALDLFCGAGGASRGLQLAGFHVTGIDIKPQPNYCGDEFMQLDVTEIAFGWRLADFDLIWASPPCQAFTAYKRRGNVRPAPNHIPTTRDLLKRSGVPYIIENVVGAPLIAPVTLCGTMFGLGVRRHRLFETSFHAPLTPPCNHVGVQIPVYGHGAPEWYRRKWGDGYPQATNRGERRSTVEVGVYRIDLATQRIAMGIDWMQRDELSQAIPPAYAEFLGRAALAAMGRAA